MDTILAIATPIGIGGIGVIRISGKPLDMVAKIFKTTKLKSFNEAMPNMMYYGDLSTDTIKEKCLAVYYKAPHSYTGEDVVELQCHGSITLLQMIITKLIELGSVMADKGEFTKRAFLNGKVHLADAEGIIDMINADSVAGINSAFSLLKGDISRKIIELQAEIQMALAELEASMDYPDEMEDEATIMIFEVIDNQVVELKRLKDSFRYGKMAKDGVRVAIIGKANVGKSSLLNALLQTDRAIVTPIAGTTRDTITESVLINNIKVNLIDTAGIRESDDIVEQHGINRARSTALSADLVMFVSEYGKKLDCEELQLLELISDKIVLRVFNKIDLEKVKNINIIDDIYSAYISAKSGTGIDVLRDKIESVVASQNISAEGEIITNERHYSAICRAYEIMESLRKRVKNLEPCLVVLDLRQAWTTLGEITGTTATEEIIDTIFSKFCLGK